MLIELTTTNSICAPGSIGLLTGSAVTPSTAPPPRHKKRFVKKNRSSWSRFCKKRLLSILLSSFASLATLTVADDATPQTPEPFEFNEYSVRYVIVDDIVRPMVFWTIGSFRSRTTVVVSVFFVTAEGNTEEEVHSSIFDAVREKQYSDSFVDRNFTTGDSIQYWLFVATGSGSKNIYLNDDVNNRVLIPGPPLMAPPDITASYQSSTSTPTITTRLTWGELTGDENTGYTEITGYDIQYRFGEGGEWTPISPAPSSTTRSYEHTLSGEDTYRADLRYRVRATNQITELEGGPQGPWSEAVSPTTTSFDLNVESTDLNADGWVGADDMLILYYALEFGDSFQEGTNRSTATAGSLVKTLVGGLLHSTEVTDAEVLAAYDRARIVEKFGGSAIGSINASSGIDADDALILYYAAAFRDLLGDGRSGGFESMRSALLTQPSRLTDPTDVPLKAVLQSANDFLNRYR